MADTETKSFMDLFMALPAEMRETVYRLVSASDQVIVTSKPIRGRLYTTRASEVLSDPEYEAHHLDILRHAKAIIVNINDYQFSNFIKFVIAYGEKRQGGEMLKPFFFQGPSTPVSFALLEGSHFSANLRFTANFEHDQRRLQCWLRKTKQLAKDKGHLRSFYKVTHVEGSNALSNYLAATDFEDDEVEGQLMFIEKAVRSAFAPPCDTHEVDGSMNINAGWFSQDEFVPNAMLWPGNPADMFAVKGEREDMDDGNAMMEEGGAFELEVKQEPVEDDDVEPEQEQDVMWTPEQYQMAMAMAPPVPAFGGLPMPASGAREVPMQGRQAAPMPFDGLAPFDGWP